ncbi:hypothetical protein ACL7TT_08100 [Microbulbifer sp. 2304DJ12-6]|uniref:DISARM anti-phage system protein DrmE domain-containing protein n=1 Tax=Microbulbifer sp. 2304DJ12-6 TaxID=3233340 RepID=UPI0039B08EC7
MADWSSYAKELGEAIPGGALLATSNLPASTQQGLASSVYRLKNGESVILTLPSSMPDQLTGVIEFMHGIRAQALAGLIKASWINGLRMSGTPDMLVWTRAMPQYQRLKLKRELSAQHVAMDQRSGQLREPLQHADRMARTLICQQNTHLTRFVDTLSLEVKPFLIVVDLTPYGYRDNPQDLIDHLTGYFPRCPKLILTNTADTSMNRWLQNEQPVGVVWQQHTRDETPHGAGHPITQHITIAELPDKRFADRLVQLMSDYHDLKGLLKNEGASGKKALTALNKILCSLRNLAMPLPFYERLLDRKRCGGLYPVKPLSEWLDQLRYLRFGIGQTQSLIEALVNQLDELINMVMEGETGKSQAIQHWLQSVGGIRDSRVIIVGSEREAFFLRDWLVRDYATEMDKGLLTVLGAGSARQCYKHAHQVFDEAMVVGHLWDSEHWSLSLSRSTHWLAYPFEINWFTHTTQAWLSAYAATEEGKLAWWQMKAAPFVPILHSKSMPEFDVWGLCSGQYKTKRTIELNIPEWANWMDALLEEFEEAIVERAEHGPPSPGEVTIELSSGELRRFSLWEGIDRLSDDEKTGLERVLASDLSLGDEIVLINDETCESSTLVEILVDYATENSTQHQVNQAQVGRWFSYVDHAVHETGSVEQLHRQLQIEGVQIGMESVKRWSRHLVINPQNKKKIVPIMAKLGKHNPTSGDINAVLQAQSKMHGLRSQMGKQVRQLAIANKTGTTVTGSISGILDTELLADLVAIEEVVSLRRHGEVTHDEPLSLRKVLEEGVDKSQGKLVATSSALRSAEESVFQDCNKVAKCLSILASHYYEVYAKDKKIKLTEAIEAGRPFQIDFKSDTAPTTKGRFSTYKREYNGISVDIGKHLEIGNSGSPEHCFRLHFHWDEAEQQIVIHHAGRHLPTNSG